MNSYDLIRTFLFNQLTPHWWLGLGVDLLIFILKIICFHTNPIEQIHIKSAPHKIVVLPQDTFALSQADKLLQSTVSVQSVKSFCLWELLKRNEQSRIMKSLSETNTAGDVSLQVLILWFSSRQSRWSSTYSCAEIWETVLIQLFSDSVCSWYRTHSGRFFLCISVP